jgi:hypothetical protein
VGGSQALRLAGALLTSGALGACGESASLPYAPTPFTPPSVVTLGGVVFDVGASRAIPGVFVSWSAAGGFPTTATTGPDGRVIPVRALDVADLLINIPGCSTIYGRVVDAATKSPLAGATVELVRAATTDASGYYRISFECRPGAYGTNTTVIRVSMPGYSTLQVLGGRAEDLGNPGESRRDFALTR